MMMLPQIGGRMTRFGRTEASPIGLEVEYAAGIWRGHENDFGKEANRCLCSGRCHLSADH